MIIMFILILNYLYIQIFLKKFHTKLLVLVKIEEDTHVQYYFYRKTVNVNFKLKRIRNTSEALTSTKKRSLKK